MVYMVLDMSRDKGTLVLAAGMLRLRNDDGGDQTRSKKKHRCTYPPLDDKGCAEPSRPWYAVLQTNYQAEWMSRALAAAATVANRRETGACGALGALLHGQLPSNQRDPANFRDRSFRARIAVTM